MIVSFTHLKTSVFFLINGQLVYPAECTELGEKYEIHYSLNQRNNGIVAYRQSIFDTSFSQTVKEPASI